MPIPLRVDVSMVIGRLLPFWLLILLLAGCSGMDLREPTAASWEIHSEQLMLMHQWSAKGKMAVRTANASESASLVWQQDNQNTYVQLSGPLGIGATTIYSDGLELEMHQGNDHTTIDISDPDAMISNTGWDLPLHALSYWLKGIPSPDSTVQRLELDPKTELLQNLWQNDWEVRYDQYEQFEEFTLPTRLKIQRGATRAKVIISNWQTSAR